jgi:hypothetical protein
MRFICWTLLALTIGAVFAEAAGALYDHLKKVWDLDGAEIREQKELHEGSETKHSD